MPLQAMKWTRNSALAVTRSSRIPCSLLLSESLLSFLSSRALLALATDVSQEGQMEPGTRASLFGY